MANRRRSEAISNTYLDVTRKGISRIAKDKACVEEVRNSVET